MTHPMSNQLSFERVCEMLEADPMNPELNSLKNWYLSRALAMVNKLREYTQEEMQPQKWEGGVE